MTDDPYPSTRALTDALVGAFIAFLTITLPVSIVCFPLQYTNVENNVKINNIVNQS